MVTGNVRFERDIKYTITSYSITMMKDGFGWIRLKDGQRDAAYIYFTDQEGRHDRFGAEDSDHPYVVMHQPIRLWSSVIDILRYEKPLYIRGYQSESGSPVSTFFGTSMDEPVGEGGQ
jgi:hypothetical protein